MKGLGLFVSQVQLHSKTIDHSLFPIDYDIDDGIGNKLKVKLSPQGHSMKH